jgi:sugar transferase (PEP-CTERM/EpsH1 system associated)
MENGLVNIINRMPPGRYRHVIVSLTVSRDFAQRIARDDVKIVNLGEKDGHSFARYLRLWRALRALRPAIVHTRNLATIEAQIAAAFVAGTKRVHGEHGRDVFDLDGTNPRYKLLRRVVDPLIHRYIAVSRDLDAWLQNGIGIPAGRVRQIYNGVALELFCQRSGPKPDLAPPGFLAPDSVVIGTVGRLAEVKDHRTLLRAFAVLGVAQQPAAQDLRLVIAGEGPFRGELEAAIRDLGLTQRVWLAGDRSDIHRLLQMLDIFVLPSLAEGISNTILEAMATGLPVVATRVGGNVELVQDGVTGTLVPATQADALAAGIGAYIADPELRRRHGIAGRDFVARAFDWDRCVSDYLSVYDDLLGR